MKFRVMAESKNLSFRLADHLSNAATKLSTVHTRASAIIG